MSAREAFGPNLRRIRMQRGISLQTITRATNVSVALWEGLERNDLSRWPQGIYARAFVREYAEAIGVDPEATVDEFCRCFPHGDRRVEPTLRVHAEIVNHDLDYEDRPPRAIAEGDRRAGSPSATPSTDPAKKSEASSMVAWLRRAVGRA